MIHCALTCAYALSYPAHVRVRALIVQHMCALARTWGQWQHFHQALHVQHFVGLQPTVIASHAPHLLLKQSVMTRKE